MKSFRFNHKGFLNENNIAIFYLIIIGELIFALPFHISRFFRPSLIEDFNYSNMTLGIAFSVYGITALISYIPGGYIADKLRPKYLLSLSLFLTSLGGLVFLFNPKGNWLYFIYGYWGVTTILFFWGALIKATRNISGNNQGLYFGALEAGRGLVASLSASLAVLIYTNKIIPLLVSEVLGKQVTSLSIVIFFYSLITFLSGLMILFFFNDKTDTSLNIQKKFIKTIFDNFRSIVCIALVVLAAYSGYKGIDYYSLYFYHILEYTKEDSAILITNLSYLRPISAILAGIIADKISSRKCTYLLFLSLMFSYLGLTIISNSDQIISLLFFNFMVSLVAIFSLRGIFYSLLKETKIPVSITGISVGIISLIGYFPDVFIGPVFGILLANNSISDFQNCFIFLLVLSFLGYILSLFLPKKILN